MKKEIVSRDAATVVARILDAAQAEFMQVGYERANTNRMAADFGLSKATIFRHFRTKRDLFQAVLTRIAGGWSERVEQDVSCDTPPEEWLRSFGGTTLRWLLSEEALFVGRMAISEGDAHDDVRDIWPRFVTAPIHGILAKRLAGWQERGQIGAGPAEALAGHFLDLALAGKVSRALYRSEAKGTSDELDQHVAFCVDLFLDGCRN